MLATFFLTRLGNSLLHLHGWQAYGLVAVLCFGEIGLFIGFILPGEIAVTYGGVLAARHQVDLVTMLILVNVCAVAGNLTGYAIGRRIGPTLMAHRPLRGKQTVERSRELLQKRGASAVFVGRFVVVVRAFAPPVAGMSEMPFGPYALASLASGVLWATGFCLAGYLAGVSYAKVITVAGQSSAILVGVLIVGGIVAYVWRRRVRHAKNSAEIYRGNAVQGVEDAPVGESSVNPD